MLDPSTEPPVQVCGPCLYMLKRGLEVHQEDMIDSH
jgi:hypothetical protein